MYLQNCTTMIIWDHARDLFQNLRRKYQVKWKKTFKKSSQHKKMIQDLLYIFL